LFAPHESSVSFSRKFALLLLLLMLWHLLLLRLKLLYFLFC
jgi:hypothetical protein